LIKGDGENVSAFGGRDAKPCLSTDESKALRKFNHEQVRTNRKKIEGRVKNGEAARPQIPIERVGDNPSRGAKLATAVCKSQRKGEPRGTSLKEVAQGSKTTS